MTQRERGLMLKLAEELGKARVRIEEIEKELEKLKENQYDLHSDRMTLDEKMLIQILARYVEELKELDKRRETILKLKKYIGF